MRFLIAGLLLPAHLLAQQAPDSAQPISTITVEGRRDNLNGIAATASVGRVGWRDLRLRPLAREGELLETVPGMILTQHSGDGLEDNRVRGNSASLVSRTAGYRFADACVSVSLMNAFNTPARDVQYFYASRLEGEPAEGVARVHYDPAEPRQVRIGIAFGL